jgi:hypothetical protein
MAAVEGRELSRPIGRPDRGAAWQGDLERAVRVAVDAFGAEWLMFGSPALRLYAVEAT